MLYSSRKEKIESLSGEAKNSIGAREHRILAVESVFFVVVEQSMIMLDAWDEHTLYDTEHFCARSSVSDDTRSSTAGREVTLVWLAVTASLTSWELDGTAHLSWRRQHASREPSLPPALDTFLPLTPPLCRVVSGQPIPTSEFNTSNSVS